MKAGFLALLLNVLFCSPVKGGLQSHLKEKSRDDPQYVTGTLQETPQATHQEQAGSNDTLHSCPNLQHELDTPSACTAELLHPIGELAKKRHDGNHYSQVLQNIHAGCRMEGRLSDALRDVENALAVAMASEQNAHSDTANVLHVLGNVHLEMGNISKALQLYDEATQVQSMLPQLSIEMGEAHARRGLLNMASDHLRKVLERVIPESVDAARAHSLDGFVILCRGDANASIQRLQEALRIQTKALHSAHPDLVLTKRRMARAQRDLGRLDEALQTTEALEQVLQDLPSGKLELSRVLMQKADLLRELERLPDAEQTMKQVSTMQASIFSKKAEPDVASALNIYGGIFHDQGKFAEANIQYQEALTMNLDSVGKWHPETAAIHNSLGTLFQDVGDLTAAGVHFRECLDIQLKTLGGDNPEVASTYNNIATTLFQQGRPKEAAELLEEALSVLDAAQVPKESPDRRIYAENLEAIL
mmetsp:Transcript_26746/g.46378  ORF Transcript_26746/g.46378 Transcript_26746/m.46378 type:complete len:475 (-) Transcript_26746:24-1448(-)